jgi:outer membrane protein insertion porin family
VPKNLWLALIILFLISLNAQAESDVPKGKISEILVNGSRLIDEEIIREQIETKIGESIEREKVLLDLKRIYNLGFFEAKGVEVKPLRKEDDTIILVYQVKENAPVTDVLVIGNNASIDINAYAFFEDLISKPENSKALYERIRALETAYMQKGFILAKVSDIDLDEKGRLLVIIDEGNINSIVFEGNKKTKNSYLNHLVNSTKTGTPYNEFDFSKDFKKLQGAGYFTNVSRSVKPSDSGSGYDLVINLNEKEKYTTVGLGGGVNSSAGLFGNTNLTVGNIHGQGETLNVTAILGSGLGAGSTLNTNSNFVRRGNFNQITANYFTPYYRNTDYSLTKSLNLTRGPNFNVDLSRQNAASIGATLGRSLKDHHRFTVGATANYIDLTDRDRSQYVTEVAKNIIEEDQITRRDLLEAQNKGFLGGKLGLAKIEARKLRDEQIVDGLYASFRPGYSYVNLDDASKPRDGWRSNWNVNPNVGFGDISSFTKLQTSTTRYFPVGKESSFLFNFRGGYRLLGEIPQFEKFRLGTATGIRGYRQFTELGMGDKLFISTAEFRTPSYKVAPFVKKFKYSKYVDFATFADAGVIGGDGRLNKLTDRLSQAASIGFGIRVRLPLVGALRLDVGFPLIEAITKDHKLFRVNFGPADIF